MQIFAHRPNIDFMGHRRGALVLSTVAVLLSIGSLLYRGLNYSEEFTGVVIIEATYPQPADLTAIRTNLETAGFKDVHDQYVGASTDVLIRMPAPEGDKDVGVTRDRVEKVLRSNDEKIDIRRF